MNWVARCIGVVVLSSCADGPITGGPDSGVSEPVASAFQFTLECPERGMRAYDSTRTLIGGVPFECKAHVADRSGAPLGGRAVTFLTEAGRFTADPLTSAAGVATLRVETSLPLPVDVAPEVFTWVPFDDDIHTGEFVAPLWMEPFTWTEVLDTPPGLLNPTLREPRRPDPLRLKPDGTRFENNPRDNLVTLVAWTEGEEGFQDDNGNGTYEVGELFVDLTEPFVDANDDGTRGPQEPFVDTNGNGQWDGKNFKWDARTKIWVQQRVLWTGLPAAEDAMLTVVGVTSNRPSIGSLPSSVVLSCPGTGTTCAQAGPPLDVFLRLSDPWLNRLAHEGESDSCTLSSSPAVVLVPPTLSFRRGEVWPAAERFFMRVSDERDPMGAGTPRRSPPEAFTVSFFCDFSPRRGAPPERIMFSGLRGTIE